MALRRGCCIAVGFSVGEVMQLWEEPFQLRDRNSASGIDWQIQKVKWGTGMLFLEALLWKEGIHYGKQWEVCGPQGSLIGESLKAWRKLAGGPAFSGGRRRRKWRKRRRENAKIFSTVNEERLEVGAEYRWDDLCQCGELEKACCLPWIFPWRSPKSGRRCWGGRSLKRMDKVWGGAGVWKGERNVEKDYHQGAGWARVRDHR